MELATGNHCSIVLPTGTGKTRTALAVCERMLHNGGSALWLVDKVNLVRQTEKAAVGFGVPVEVKTIQKLAYRSKAKCRECKGGKVTTAHGTVEIDCDVCNGTGRLPTPPIKPGDYDVIIADEAHKFLTDNRLKILDEAKTPVLGLTATPRRGDGKHIKEFFGDKYVGGPYSIGAAISDGWLCDCALKRVELRELDLRQVKRTNGGKGDFDEAELAAAMNVPSINEEIVRRWREEAALESGLMLTNFFCVDTAHADAMAEEVNRQCGEGTCVPIHSNLAGNLAEHRTEGFLAGKWRVVTSVMMIAEGFDYPALQCGVLARPTQSERLLVQMLGRLLRILGGRYSPDKPAALLLDCDGAYETLDLSRIYDAVAPQAATEPTITVEGNGEQEEIDAIPMLSNVISQVRAIDLFRRQCADARKLTWHYVDGATPVGKPIYVLRLGEKDWLVIGESRFEPTKVAAARFYYDKGYARCQTLTSASPEPEAFARSEAWAQGHRAFLAPGHRHAAFKAVKDWYKNRSPPSDEMVSRLKEHGIEAPSQHGAAYRRLRQLYASGRIQ